MKEKGFPAKPLLETLEVPDCPLITLANVKFRENFFVQGPRKSGKTSYLTYIAREQLLPKRVSFQYFKIDDIVSNVTESWNNPNLRREYMSKIKSTHVIFIDDLGTETSGKELTIKALTHFLSYRIDEFLPVIISSLVPHKIIKEEYGETISEYLTSFNVLTIKNDFRR